MKILLPILAILLIGCQKPNDPPNIDLPYGSKMTDFEAAWSPSGEEIAYIHGDTVAGQTGIYLINTDGTNNRLLISSATAHTPAWIPNSEWIVFSMSAQIFKIKTNGDSLSQLTSLGRNFFPAVSPNGRWITFDSGMETSNGMKYIWKMSIDGANKSRIAYAPKVGEIRMPYWSADNQILHVRYSQEYFSTEIFTMDSSGNNVTRITFNEATDQYPRYSVMAGKIAYTSQAEGNHPVIMLIDIDGKNLSQLTKVQSSTCDWSPRGDKIVYTDTRIESGNLWIIDSDGSNPKQLTFDTQQ